MSILDKMQEVGTKVEVAEWETSITGMDFELAHIELDPELAKFHPDLKADKETLEQSIDTLYTAANAGYWLAKWFVFAAARNQVMSARNIGEPIGALPESLTVMDHELRAYEREADWRDQQRAPLDRVAALRGLDDSLALIELTIEDVKNGFIGTE